MNFCTVEFPQLAQAYKIHASALWQLIGYDSYNCLPYLNIPLRVNTTMLTERF